MASYLAQFTDTTTNVVIEQLLLPDDVAEQAATAHADYLSELNRHPVTAQLLPAVGQATGWARALCMGSIRA